MEPLKNYQNSPKGSSNGRHNLPDKSVEVGVSGSLDVQVSPADVVDRLVVYHEGAVGVLQGGVGGEDGVVGLHNSCSHLCITGIRNGLKSQIFVYSDYKQDKLGNVRLYEQLLS